MFRSLALVRALVSLAMLGPAIAFAFPEPRRTPAVHEAVPGEVIVRYRPQATGAQREGLRARAHGVVKHRFRRPELELLDVGARDVSEVVAELSADPAVAYAEPNYRFHALAGPPAAAAIAAEPGDPPVVAPHVTPDDPLFHLQWGLRNTGQSGGTIGADIDATSAWDVFSGDPEVLVGVIDTGIDTAHPDLVDNLWTNPGEIPGNRADDDGNGYVDDVHGWDAVNLDGDPSDDHGHGTHVAGTIAARGDNGIGVAGVSWRARIVAIKFLDANGQGTLGSALMALDYAMTVGVRLTNNSWGGGPFAQALLDAIRDADAAGQLFVAAAGNDFGRDLDTDPHYPASYPVPNVIAVAATNDHDRLAGFSNRGATTVHVAAPGDSIVSTLPGNRYGYASGTSMAAPHVSGVLALMFGRRPGLDAVGARQILLASADSLPSLDGLVLRSKRLDALLATADPDSIPPGPILDLTATPTVTNSVVLRWIATGDDGSEGRSSRHEVRSSTAPITPGNFRSATLHPSPDPPPAGATAELEVGGLRFGTTYHFAVRALDEFSNEGPLSDVVVATTLAPPALELVPGAVHETVLGTGSATRAVTLHNHGAGALDFTIPPPTPRFAAMAAQPWLDLAKGAIDPRVGPPVVDGRGGPDGAGYRWIDSTEPGGPVFQWIDLATIGTPLDIVGDEDIDLQVPIGFPFTFYGNTYERVNVGSNGWLSFTSTRTPTFTPQPLPNAGPRTPENMIAPFWTDLDFEGVRRASYHTDGERFVVTYLNVPHFFFPGTYTFQAILERSGSIRFQYLEILGVREFSTVGIQNLTRDVGLQVAFNSSYVRPGLAVRIDPTPAWLSVAPRSGRVLGGESLDLEVGVSGAGLIGGTYRASVVVQSNDPARPEVDLPVQMDLVGVPDLGVSAAAVDFGAHLVGAAAAETLAVHNAGNDTLRVTSIVTDHPAFASPRTSLIVRPRGTAALPLTFSPGAPGPVSATLTLRGNDPDRPEATVSLSGTGLPPPEIDVSPRSIDATVPVGGRVARTLRIDNRGTAELRVRVDFERGAPHAIIAAGVPEEDLGARRQTVDEPAGGNRGPAEVTLNSDPGRAPARTLAGTYAGAQLVFAITDRGEIGLLQFPHGGEHLQVGAVLSGYTIGYRAAGNEHVFFAALGQSYGILPVSFVERSVTPEHVRLEVETRTLDERVRIVREVDFIRADPFVRVRTRLENLSAAPLEGVVLKEYADWDVDGDFADDDWRYDRGLGAVIASDAHYVALAADRSPELMDFGGWTDVSTYATRVDPREGPVTDYDGLALLHHDLGTVAPGPVRTITAAYAAGVDLASVRDAVRRAVPNLGWLSADRLELAIPAGAGADLELSLDATRLVGGDYHAQVRLDSNDPDDPELRIPLTLRVRGVPDLVVAPASIDFGATFTGFVARETLIVRNAGSDSLRVASVTSSDGRFGAPAAPFVVGPADEVELPITFTSSADADASGVLEIRSNDPDTPVLEVPVSAVALVPPRAVVEPDSVTAALLSGHDAVRAIRIANPGGSRLEARIRVVPLAPPDPDGAATAALRTRAASGGPRSGDAFDARHEESWAARAAAAAPRLASRAPAPAFDAGVLPVVLADASGDGGPVDLVRLRAGVVDGELRVRLDLSTPFVSSAFGGVLSLDLDRDRATGVRPTFGLPGQDVGTDAEVTFFAIAFGLVELWDRHGYAGAYPIAATRDGFSFAIPLSALADDGAMDVTGVVGTAGGATDWFPEAGHGTIFGQEWLTIEPATIQVPAGGTAELEARFDAAGVGSGTYRARIVIETNEPAREGPLEVQGRLTVTGAPHWEVVREPAGYESVIVGGVRADSLAVRNSGSETLVVSRVEITDPAFTMDVTGFELEPGATRGFEVRFQPTVAGAVAAALRLHGNDPARPVATIPLHGVGVMPPRALLSAEWFRAALAPELGERARFRTQMLVVRNVGGSPLRASLANPDPGAAWLGTGALPAEIAPGDSARIEIRFDASGIAPGVHATVLRLSSDDPGAPQRAIACTLRVGALAAALEIQPGDLNPRSQGRWVQAKLALPDGWDPRALDLATFRAQDVIPIAADGPVQISGRSIHVKLDRQAMIAERSRVPGAPVHASVAIPDVAWFHGVDAAAGKAAGPEAGASSPLASRGATPERALPEAFAIRSVSANPGPGDLVFELAMPRPDRAEIEIFDVRGARVRRLVAHELEAGWHRVTWDGRGDGGAPAEAGLYFVRAIGSGQGARTRVVLHR